MMKKNLLYICLILLALSVDIISQEDYIRCYTDEINNDLLLNDPSAQLRMQSLEQSILEMMNSGALELLQDNIYVIPVVVHVLWNTTSQNISDERIISQIRILNEDYRKMQGTNGYNNNEVGSNSNFHYRLAQFDPAGQPTTGITRTQTSVTSFNAPDSRIYSTALGGHDPWNQAKYLNIWVCNLGGGILGYSYYPGAYPARDGVVILHSAFGDNSPLYPYHKGRTSTHEIGHYMNLIHTWGNSGGCTDDDGCADTPNSAAPNYGCPTGHVSCGTVDMIENYMDYTDDLCMNIFTICQAGRMTLVGNGYRANMFLNQPFTTEAVNLTVSDATGDNRETVTFGFDDNGTDAIERELGEVALLSTIVPTMFDARLVIPSGANSTLMDLRSSTISEATWTLIFNSPGGNYPFTFEWDPAQLPEGTFTLRNSNGTIEIDMSAQNSYVLTDNLVSTMYIDYSDEPVPVELASFNSSVDNNSVNLIWTTATELNNKGFVIERSFNEYPGWSDVSFVNSHGTSTDPHTYSFIDKVMAPGKYFYRLRIVDINGAYEYSNVLEAEVKVPGVYRLSQNYPNPFNPATVINFALPNNAHVTLKVYDALGNEVAILVDGMQAAGEHNVNFDASGFPSGVYFYTLIANDFNKTEKMLLLK